MKKTQRTKEQILKSSEQHRQSIRQELSNITSQTNDIAQKALIGGVIAALSFGLLKLLSRDTDKKQIKRMAIQSGWSRVGKVLTHQAVLYILKESREKIMEYINSLEKDDK